MSDEQVASVQKVYQVLLDGQQRITTMYLLVTGEIPPYYKEEELSSDPRHLCFNLETRDFQFYKEEWMRTKVGRKLRTSLQNKVSWHQIAIERAEKYRELKQLAEFNFDFDVSDRSRAFGEIRTLIESTGLKMRFAAMQIWHIIIPTKLIKVTITELNELYEGFETGKRGKDDERFYGF